MNNTSIALPTMLRFLSPIFFAAVLTFSLPLQAQTRYVTDELEVMLRSGPSNKNKILRILKSGDGLQVLKADAGDGYSQVRNSRGDEGFVLTRYLTNQPSSRNRVKSLEAQIQQLRAKPGELQSLLATAQDDNQALITQNTDLTAKLTQTSKELDNIKRVSSDAVNIANRNSKLEGEVQDLLLELDKMRLDNEDLKDQSAQRWFMIGAGAVGFGLFLGWLLSISKRPRRQSWGS